VLLILYTEELNKKVMQKFLETLSAGMVPGCKKAGPGGPLPLNSYLLSNDLQRKYVDCKMWTKDELAFLVTQY